MANLPLEDHSVRPFEAPPYDLNLVCAAPGCDQPSQDPHHLWRRSFLGGAYDWVQITPMMAVGNVIGLCRHHHDQVEANAAWITLEDGLFCWTTLLSASQALLWQPPVMALEGAGASTDALDAPVPASASIEELWEEQNETLDGLAPFMLDDPSPLVTLTTALQDPDAPKASEEEIQRAIDDLNGICPSCKRPLPHPKHEGPPEAKRPRRSWTITVPKDERENGAAVLDELLEASREEMGKLGLPYGEEASVRYFVLTAVLALFVQHAEQLMADA